MKNKRILILLLALCLAFSLYSCGEGDASNGGASYDDASSDWKPSLLDKAGLATIAEPDGEKEFTVDENGNVTFTIKSFDVNKLNSFALGIYSELNNFTDEINPKSFNDAFSSETSFKISYTIDNVGVTLELTLEESILKGVITYS